VLEGCSAGERLRSCACQPCSPFPALGLLPPLGLGGAMPKSLLRAVGDAYGLEAGVQTRVGQALQLKMGLTNEDLEFIRRLSPECWLVVRMDDFDAEVQLSFFVLCSSSSSAAAPLRMTKKTRGLRYMHEAEFHVTGGTPVAHCTLLLRKRRRNVFLSFLEKDRTRRSKGLNLGQFLMGVALRAAVPFCESDADMAVEAADSGSGRLVAFYKKLGLRVEGQRRDSHTRMRGSIADVLAACGATGRRSPGGLAALEAAEAEGAGEPLGGLAGMEECVGCAPSSPSGSLSGDLCAICIEPLAAGVAGVPASRRCALACGHCFHVACIRRWLVNSLHCPLCKRTVTDAAFPSA